MYLLPTSKYSKTAHKLNKHGKPICGTKMIYGTRSEELGDYKLCSNCLDAEQGKGFGRASVSHKACFN